MLPERGAVFLRDVLHPLHEKGDFARAPEIAHLRLVQRAPVLRLLRLRLGFGDEIFVLFHLNLQQIKKPHAIA